MKITNKDKRIHTIPEGVWEGGIVNDNQHRSKKQHLNEISTDIQGNGYPLFHKNQDE